MAQRHTAPELNCEFVLVVKTDLPHELDGLAEY